MHLAIDASNIRQGGGVTHLKELLNAANPTEAGIDKVSVWASKETLAQLPFRPWLAKISTSWADAAFIKRFLGQQFLFKKELKFHGCDVLFSPGGTVPVGINLPVVTMSQNLLPFEPNEAMRFGAWSWMRLKMWLLRQTQGGSFRRSSGVIFLTNYAKNRVLKFVGQIQGRSEVIAHGIDSRFLIPPRLQKCASEITFKEPLKILYVSILMPYKHQIEVAHALHELRSQGFMIQGNFVGADWGNYGRQFRSTLKKLDSDFEYLKWFGEVPFEELHNEYRNTDIFIFASSCENLPNILIEAMAAGLPIACSKNGPMPEILGSAGVYFDPESSASIAQTLGKLIIDSKERERLANAAHMLAKKYSWTRCSRETFHFIKMLQPSKAK